jgi:hypothetical protein
LNLPTFSALPSALIAFSTIALASAASSAHAVVPVGPVAALTTGEAEAAVAEALSLWAAAGLDTGTLRALSQTAVVIAPLAAGYLGLATPGVIYLDPTAEGYGWFTNPSHAANPPANRIDLLTVVRRERA